tara:strand:+ start:4607 stop:5758 length:1152 start_codon:yes stop_codon:yes gene_type:complete
MADPNDKLDFSAISFDNVVGDGAPGLELDAQNAEPIDDDIEQDVEAIDEDPRERGDEDREDYVDEDYEEDDEDYTVEGSDDDEEEYDEEYDDDDVEDYDDEDVPISERISEVLGVEMEYEYADTVEGLTNYVRDVSEEVAEAQIQDLFEEYPEVQRHLEFVLAGGDPEQFYAVNNPQSDYSNIELSERDVTLQRAMLGEYFTAMGHPEDFILEMLNDYEDSGKLYDKALIAQKELSAVQAEQREQMYEEQLVAQEEAEIEQNEFWDNVAGIIEGGNEFAGIVIPDTDKANFFDYISAPVDEEGNTQRDLDYSEANVDIKLAIDYLMYSGFNLADIIDTKARTKSVESLRGRIQANEDRVKSARRSQRRTKTFDPDQLDINALF